MKIAMAVAAGLLISTSHVSADTFRFDRVLGNAGKKIRTAVTQGTKKNNVGAAIAAGTAGAVVGTIVGGAVGGNSGGAAFGAAVGVIATVGAILILDDLEKQRGSRPQQRGGGLAAPQSGGGGQGQAVSGPPQPSDEEIQREAHREIQRRLNILGFDAGPEDGQPGRRTRNAVSSFQASIGHPSTGELDPEQTALLYANSNPSAVAELTDPVMTSVPAAPPVLPAGQSLPEAGNMVINPSAQNQQVPGGQGQTIAASLERVPAGLAGPDYSVLGIRPLDDMADVETRLAELGFQNCETVGASLACEADRGQLVDKLVIGFSTEGAGQVVHTLAREIVFSAPERRQAIVDQFNAAYPGLVGVPGMTLASSGVCMAQALPFHASRFQELLDWAVSGEAPTDRVSALAGACDYHYSLSIPSGNRIDSVSINLFKGGPIRSALAQNTAPAAGPVQIRF